ncbi:MAG: enoyl-CoA hydratase/isomerase family protein [Desulfuromonadales bacterium]|nr:enoyl-CoA hydratase/isomerase family protein [Desulfuromonadales bacterium]NIR34350.1 enoyl-CoA hydratase/isomerase family protein [Desulfuromonadales bacterium]NIS40410.1 enoyl-CoA hydratase/isomerase family protein [Desulfuromonadales bacterium]
MSENHVLLHRQDNLALVEINRPQTFNAVNTAALERLLQIFTDLRHDDSVHGVLLCAAGDNFSSGGDLGELRELTPLQATRFAELGQSVCLAMERLGKPLLVAVSGYVLGAGLELALCCDFIIAADDAKFGFREIEYGVIPGFGGTQRLPRLVGKSRAKELIFTGELIEAEEAAGFRLVNRIVPAAQLRERAVERLSVICSRGLVSLKMAKEVIDAGYDINLSTACLMERDAFAVCFSTEDQKEGMGAFVEKRPARFKGK